MIDLRDFNNWMRKDMNEKPTHFKGKEAISHVIEAQTRGIIASSEIHGTEIPGHLAACMDALRDTSMVLLLTFVSLLPLKLETSYAFILLASLSAGWIVWKSGRSGFLGWSRLERLHRIVEQEKWEIEHNRSQEREELTALYAAKGFEGKLLEDVIDVLMSDGDRLLRVMVEEELGLTLQVHEHPLKQALGAFFGALISSLLILFSFYFFPSKGVYLVVLLLLGISSGLSAMQQQNTLIPAIIWTLGLGALALSFSYFLLQYLSQVSL